MILASFDKSCHSGQAGQFGQATLQDFTGKFALRTFCSGNSAWPWWLVIKHSADDFRVLARVKVTIKVTVKYLRFERRKCRMLHLERRGKEGEFILPFKLFWGTLLNC